MQAIQQKWRCLQSTDTTSSVNYILLKMLVSESDLIWRRGLQPEDNVDKTMHLKQFNDLNLF